MDNVRMPAIFVGHGSPMLALEHSGVTRRLRALGEEVTAIFGLPKAILMLSAHWYKNRSLVQLTLHPKQIYDMYGFPPELYEVKYQPVGCEELSRSVMSLMGSDVAVDNTWGIDHGAWTPLVHMFPDASVPVVQISVNAAAGALGCYEIGRRLARLRDEGYMIMGSGNVVHNLRMVNWDSAGGSWEALAFDRYVVEAIEKRSDRKIIDYTDNANAHYAVPTADHFLPLLYVLGASDGERPMVFNNLCTLDSMSMTGFAFGLTSSE